MRVIDRVLLGFKASILLLRRCVCRQGLTITAAVTNATVFSSAPGQLAAHPETIKMSLGLQIETLNRQHWGKVWTRRQLLTRGKWSNPSASIQSCNCPLGGTSKV